MTLQRVLRAIPTMNPNASPDNSPQMAIQRKSYVNQGAAVVKTIRDTYGIQPGNRTDGVISTKGASFANINLGRFLAQMANDGEGFWSDTGLNKKATISYELKSANCDEFGMMAYLEMRAANTGGNIGIEQQSGHTYSYAFDDENKSDPAKQTIVDPWVRRAELRADDKYYNQKRNVTKTGKSDGTGWYMKDLYGEQMKKLKSGWEIKWKKDASLGLNLALKKQSGQDVPGMYAD